MADMAWREGSAQKRTGLRKWARPVALILFAMAVLAAFGLAGTPIGHSYLHNLPWFIGFREAFAGGTLWPRFIPYLWWGMGGLDFFFYAPMPFWIASLLGTASCLGHCSADTAFALGGGWMFLFSAASMYLLARNFLTARLALLAGLIYMLLPYKLLGDWVARQAVGEIAVAIFLPLLLHFQLKLARGTRGGIGYALSFAAIMLSHLPIAVLAALFSAVLAIVQILPCQSDAKLRLRRLLNFVLFGGLGVTLAGAYWLPALLALDTVSPELLTNHFLTPSNWLYLDGRPEPGPVISFRMKLVLLASLVVAGLFAVFSQASIELKLLVLGPVLYTAFLNSVFSSAVWTISPFSSVQFPFRSFIILEVGLALGLVALMKAALRGGVRPALAAGAASLLIGATAFPMAGLHNPSGKKAELFMEAGTLDYVPEPMALAMFDAVNRTGTSTYLEWQSIIRDFAEKGTPVEWTSNRTGSVELAGGPVKLAWHPAWTAMRDDTGEAVALSPSPTGLTLAEATSGSGITLRLGALRGERLGWTLSLLALFAIGLIALRRRLI